MKSYFWILLLLILCACQNIENGKKNSLIKKEKEKEKSINMKSTISEIEIKN